MHATNIAVILRSAPKARISKDGSKLGARFHPSRRSRASTRDLLRMTLSLLHALSKQLP
jgi:hypothetical protein